MYFPRSHRYYQPLLVLMAAEVPLVILILILTGIASHDLYRTVLWQDGADNGFNSSPSEVLYAAANYRPFKVPLVWSSFTTNFNLVIGVLSVFLLITKLPMLILKLFYPPISVFINGSCVALFIVAARCQAGPDMSDPQHPQPGPPWYITKNCNVAAHKADIGFCQQAKTLFAVTVVIIVIYFSEFVLSVISCFETKEEREKRKERQEEKRALKEYEDMILKSPIVIPMTPGPFTGQMTPSGFGGSFPLETPCTFAFNRLDGTSSDLPLRDHFSSPNPYRSSSSHQEQSFAFRTVNQPQLVQPQPVQPQIYFPPPPKQASK